MFFYIVSDPHARQSFGFGKIEEAFHFTVKAMAYLFQHDIGVGILTGMLSDSGDTGKYFIDIRHSEVSAESQILGTPVVSSQKRMYIGNSGFSGGGITQMPHVCFTGKR